jgi:peroxiredoxin
LAAAVVAFASCSNGGYKITGNVAGDDEVLKNGKAYLVSSDRKNPTRDTVDIVNGKFEFTGVVVDPENYYIQIEGLPGYMILFLENTSFTVSASSDKLNEAEIKGGETQTLVALVDSYGKDVQNELIPDRKALLDEYRDKNTTPERKSEIVALFDQVDAKVKAFSDSIIAANPLSYYSLMQFASDVLDMPLEKAEQALAEFKKDERFANHKRLVAAEELIVKERALQVGQVAPDFTMKDPDGNEVKLSDIYKKGKVTMIDFWAGWCNPCRQFNPKLVKIYKEYHKKGFEILGVSLDRDRDQWLDAIKTDKLTWTQVSDINFWDTEAAKLYNVRYIPQNAFVDGEGKIIARRVSEEEIIKLLEERLK